MTHLPAEVRNDIFKLALTESVDMSVPYEGAHIMFAQAIWGLAGPTRSSSEHAGPPTATAGSCCI